MKQIFRRADPAGRTIGEFVREELSAKVGGADVFVGLPESGEEDSLVALLSKINETFFLIKLKCKWNIEGVKWRLDVLLHKFSEQSRMWKLEGRGYTETFLSTLCPEFLGRRAELAAWEIWYG